MTRPGDDDGLYAPEARVVRAARRWTACAQAGVADGDVERELEEATRAYEKWRGVRPMKVTTKRGAT